MKDCEFQKAQTVKTFVSLYKKLVKIFPQFFGSRAESLRSQILVISPDIFFRPRIAVAVTVAVLIAVAVTVAVD